MITYKSMAVKLKEIVDPFIGIIREMIFPELCILCSDKLYHGEKYTRFAPVCENCISQIKKISGTRCNICGMPLPEGFSICARCRSAHFEFYDNYSIFDYRDWDIRRLIFHYKFKNRKRIARYFAHELYETISNRYGDALIVPVPTGRAVVRKRGWGHMEIIGKILSGKYNMNVAELLKKRQKAPQQKSLDLKGRLALGKGKFVFRKRKVKETISRGWTDRREVVLIDDIFTTGATASECSHVLKSIGFKVVHVITLAID